ncbi:MAG: FG-GAP repeat domain-containing protein, partial [bacterium]
MKIMPACDSSQGNKPVMKKLFFAVAAGVMALPVAADEDLIAFGREGSALNRTVIDANLPGAYQVEIADVNGDGKPEVVALGGGTVAWYENPSWQKRIVSDGKTTPGVISTATADIDGDGKAEVAIAYEFE